MDDDVERTVLCLVHPAAREREAPIREALKSKYKIDVKQRTTRCLTVEQAEKLASDWCEFGIKAEAEKEAAQAQLAEKSAQASAQATPKAAGGKGKKEFKPPTPRQFTEEELAEAARIAEERALQAHQQRVIRYSKMFPQIVERNGPVVPESGENNDVVILSLIGVRAIEAVEEAFRSDEQLRQLAGIRDDEITDSEEKQDEEKEQQVELADSSQFEGNEEKGCSETDSGEKSPAGRISSRWNVLFPSSCQCSDYLGEFYFKPQLLGDLDFSSLEETEPSSLKRGENNSGRKRVVKHASLSLKELMDFVFPISEQHPKSTSRLLVFGELGPLDDSGTLRGGIRNEHILRNFEVECIAQRINITDLLYIYVKDAVLTEEEEIEVVKQADPRIRNDKQLTKEDVVALFEDLPRDKEGRLSFHEVQEVIFKFRENRIVRWKQMAANSVRSKGTGKASKLEKGRQVNHQRALRLASELHLKRPPKADDNELFLITTKLLNRHTYEICNLEDKNSPSIVQNTRILRNQSVVSRNPRKFGAIPWKNTIYSPST